MPTDLDKAFKSIQSHVFDVMTEMEIPACNMTFVVSKVLSELYSMHINELIIMEEQPDSVIEEYEPEGDK